MRTIENEKFVIYDHNEGKFHERPSVKARVDYDKIIEDIQGFNCIWDFIQLFNQTGLIAVVERHYKDGDIISGPDYDYKVRYSMFGSYVSENNTDDILDKDTGVFIMGSASTWEEDADICAQDLRKYSDEDEKIHRKVFMGPER